MLERLGALQEARDALCDEGVREEALRIDKALDSLENKILRVRSEPYTVIDYLAIPQPRTTQKEEVLSRLVPGHGHGHKSPEAGGVSQFCSNIQTIYIYMLNTCVYLFISICIYVFLVSHVIAARSALASGKS